MCYKSCSVIIVFFLLCLFSSLSADTFNVTFINPGVSNANHSTGGFWYNTSVFMKAAAADLNIDLEVLYAERKHQNLPGLVQEVADRKEKPDFLVIVNEMRTGAKQLEIAMRAGIKTFMMLNTLVEQNDVLVHGTPREKHQDWIGTLVPDNRYAGYKIAKSIIEIALKRNAFASDGKLHMVGLAGDFVTPAAVERNKGLQEAVTEYASVDLKQIFVCKWSKDEARKKTLRLFDRYPEVGVIWSANDPIALGAMEAAEKLGKKPGKDIYFGGLNWDIPALKKIQAGDLSVSMGGHFMTGGWVMVLLHDYHKGKDFKDEGTNLKMKIFDEINASNVDQYLVNFGDKQWDKIDFTRFSKVLNPNITKYEFSLNALLKQIK